MRYQGLWWGAERIWTDELVRLKLARCQFAPKGTDIIYPPAGPSASTLASIAGGPDGAIADPDSLGAAQKGLFLRLEGLFVVDATRADGSVAKECRASGMLYELVDDDWEGDESGQNEGEGTAKGKERSNDVNKLDPFNSSAGTSMHTAGQGFTAPPSLHGPSPLRPPPLPNPDPTVSVFETAAEALTQTVAATKAKKRNMDGFKFRPILPPDHEVVLSLSLISGRYYPRLFAHPLMAPTVDKALCHPPEQGGLYEYGHLWAMDGLLPGVHQSMDPTFWRGSRVQMLKDSDAAARESFKQRWDEIKSTRLHSRMPSFLEGSSHDMPMEID
ncbi:hypothetical protein A0H81_05870 [Grifola frondosa]|uniref:Cryptic loci regulator 2 C-terminal domain-containing protein n=1 Tax=Grifola frondosa TaxID=5627 RepID=A0A1C7MAV8_GRIFR|nr:hypothetical protein A0H81_05870 [Grifola frondosa]